MLVMAGLLVSEGVLKAPSPGIFELLTEVLIPYAVFYGIFGGVTGGIFAGVVAFAERRRSFDDLSIGRLAGWGVVAGVAIPSVLLAVSPPVDASPLPVFALSAGLGAGCAVGTLLLARRVPNPELGIDETLPQVVKDAHTGLTSDLRG